MSFDKDKFSLSNLYLAYKKAKAEAFYENTHFHGLEFTIYEQSLHKNLKNLYCRLTSRTVDWFNDRSFIGDHAYLPKSIDCSGWDAASDGHFRALDPIDDWQRRFDDAEFPAQATLRLVIRPTVDFQIVSALWILHVGHIFDAALDLGVSFGNRLRRSNLLTLDGGKAAANINLTSPSLFSPYFTAYRDWREGGLAAMEKALASDESILAVTMDIEKFYHRVSPKFLLRRKFLSAINVKLTSGERRFTQYFLRAIDTWYRHTPDYSQRPAGAIPVGLSASKIIANVLLVEFDRTVASKKPLYYGRYVDDIFLVLRAKGDDYSSKAVTNRIVSDFAPWLELKEKEGPLRSVRLKFPYAKDSELVFSGAKQKIFALSSAHGADLVHHIRDQIRKQSSEYRLLPSVPTTGIAMASRALLATPDASLQVDALRKADVVSVRRLGFSLLLSDIETYASDLRLDSWTDIRKEFYGLVNRHVITPIGFFSFFSYIPRVYGLMLSCGDVGDAKSLISSISAVAKVLSKTSTLGEPENKIPFDLCLEQYAMAFYQAGLQAATMREIQIESGYLSALKKLKSLSKNIRVARTLAALQKTVHEMLLADWGRRPYKDYWISGQTNDEKGPLVPRELAVRRQLRLGAIRQFRKSATDLKVPHWPALAFPTRPLRFDEIALAAPAVLSDETLYKNALKLLRGASVGSNARIGFQLRNDNEDSLEFISSGVPREVIRIAVTSVATSETQWREAALNKQDRSISRYAMFNGMMNKILQENDRPDYIVMPELCIPLRWALRAARKLAMNGVSLIAGVEYSIDKKTKKLRNDCLISLTTRWPGYSNNLVILQPKLLPAHGEKAQLKKLLKKDGMFSRPTGESERITVYAHRGFQFAALICSDLTNISHRHGLRGKVDALFALEWNQDIKTFSALVEATANDLHAFVVQVNNRTYGDSRIRSPAINDFARDVVQVKGGISDYYVVGEINYKRLRMEQRRVVKTPKFKPTPIGYIMSEARRKSIK